MFELNYIILEKMGWTYYTHTPNLAFKMLAGFNTFGKNVNGLQNRILYYFFLRGFDDKNECCLILFFLQKTIIKIMCEADCLNTNEYPSGCLLSNMWKDNYALL